MYRSGRVGVSVGSARCIGRVGSVYRSGRLDVSVGSARCIGRVGSVYRSGRLGVSVGSGRCIGRVGSVYRSGRVGVSVGSGRSGVSARVGRPDPVSRQVSSVAETGSVISRETHLHCTSPHRPQCTPPAPLLIVGRPAAGNYRQLPATVPRRRLSCCRRATDERTATYRRRLRWMKDACLQISPANGVTAQRKYCPQNQPDGREGNK